VKSSSAFIILERTLIELDDALEARSVVKRISEVWIRNRSIEYSIDRSQDIRRNREVRRTINEGTVSDGQRARA